MNNNFDFDFEPQEITMTETEIKKHKGVFSRLCLAFVVYLITVEILSFALISLLQKVAPEILSNTNYTLILSSAIQYLIAFPILYLVIKKVPAHKPEGSEFPLKRFLKLAMVGMFLMYIGNYVSSMIMIYMEELLGFVPVNSIETILEQTNPILAIAIVGIIGPIVEELMFRKFFIDRLTPYGEAVAIFFPSLMFGLIHGNLYQFFYAFLLGVAFSYIYIRSGKIIYSTLLHIFVNLFCGVLPAYILTMFNYEEFLQLMADGTVTEEYINANMLPLILLMAYEFIMLAMVGVGVYHFTKNLRNIRINKGKVRFAKGTGAEIMFFNIGTILLIAYCVIMIAVNTFTV